MPSLKEYILALRSHNPGITNKSITVYLLKDGWKIEDIEKTFNEIDVVPTVSTESMQPVQSSVVTSVPAANPLTVEVQATEIASSTSSPMSQPTSAPNSTPAPTPETAKLEIQPEELGKASIEHPTFNQVQDRINSLISNDIKTGEINSYGTATSAPVIDPIQPTISAGSTGATTTQSTSRPKFSYNEIIEKANKDIARATETISATAVVDTNIKIEKNNIPNMNPTPISMPSSTPQFASPDQPKVHKGLKWIVWAIITLLVLGGLGFGYMKYVHGIYLFVKAPFTADKAVQGLAKSLADINTAQYTLSMNFNASDMQPGIKEFDPESVVSTSANAEMDNDIQIPASPNDATEFLDMIPQDVKLDASITGIYDKKANTSSDGQVQVKGSYAGDGISLSMDVEAMKIRNDYYARINTFPSAMFPALPQIKDKWIKATLEDLEEFGVPVKEFFVFNQSDNQLTESGKQKIEKVSRLFIEKNVFTVVGEPLKVIEDKKKAIYTYEITPNLANFIDFVVAAAPIIDDGKALLEKEIAQLKSPQFAYYFNYIKDTSKITFSVDAKGVITSIKVTNAFAPKNQKIKKQLNTTIAIGFDKINQSIPLVAPTDAMPFIDAYSVFSGKDKDEVLYDRQRFLVQDIRYAITRYVKYTGTTPETLADLKKSTAELANASTTYKNINWSPSNPDYYQMYYDLATSTRPLYSGSFKNIYSSTGQDMLYKKAGPTSYALSYTIKYPKLPESSTDMLYDFLRNNDDGFTSSKSIIALPYAELNTATEKKTSLEAAENAKLDSDKDGLADSLELYLGLDPKSKDTDKDKVNDLTELQSETNPLGAGSWKVYLDSRNNK